MYNIVFFSSLYTDMAESGASLEAVKKIEDTQSVARKLGKNPKVREIAKNKATEAARKYSNTPYNTKYREAKQAVEASFPSVSRPPKLTKAEQAYTAVGDQRIRKQLGEYDAYTRRNRRIGVATGLAGLGLGAGALYLRNRQQKQKEEIEQGILNPFIRRGN